MADEPEPAVQPPIAITELKNNALNCHKVVVMAQDMCLEQLCQKHLSLFIDSEDPEAYINIVQEVFAEAMQLYTNTEAAKPEYLCRLPEDHELCSTCKVSEC
jgi:hypothetical protein